MKELCRCKMLVYKKAKPLETPEMRGKERKKKEGKHTNLFFSVSQNAFYFPMHSLDKSVMEHEIEMN